MSLPWISGNEDTRNREILQLRMPGEVFLCAFAGYIGFTVFFNIIRMVYALLKKGCGSTHAERSKQSGLPSDSTSGGVTSSEDVRGLPGWVKDLRDSGANVTLSEAGGLECDGLGNRHRFRYVMEPVRLTVEGYGGPPLQGAGKGSSNHGQERTRQQLRKHAPYVEREASSAYNTDKEKVAWRKEPEESRSREPTSEANRRRLPQTQGLYQSPVKEAECSSRCESLLIPRQEAETRINRSPKRIGDSLSNGYRSGRLTVKTERPSGYRSPKQREADCTKSRSYQASQGRCPDMQEAGRLSMGSPLGSPGDRSPPPEPQRTHQESPEVSPAPPPCSPGPQTPDYPCTRHSECSNRREGCYYRQTAEYSQRHPPLGHNQEQLSSPGTRKRQLFRYSEEDPAEKHLNSVLGQPTLCNQALPPLIQVRAVYRGQGQAPQYSQQQQAPRHLIPQQQPLHQSHQQSQHRKSSSPDRRSRRM